VLVPFWRHCGRPTPRQRPALPRTRPGTLEILLRMSKRRQGNAVLAGRISGKNKLCLQPGWSSATEAASGLPGTSPPTPASHRSHGIPGRPSGGIPARSGNKELKNALFRSAWLASCHAPVSKADYVRKRAEGKKHNAAVICLARRRCEFIHAMLRNGTFSAEKAPQAV
jgi:hypothetical protein